MSRATAFVQTAAGVGVLCLMDAGVKWLALRSDVALVTFGRYAAGAVLAAAVWAAAGRPAITRDMLPVHLARGVLIATMALAFFFGLTRLPLAEALTISFIAPLLVPPLAALTLNEPMERRFILSGLIGFAGVLVTVQGAPLLDPRRLPAILAVLYAAVAYAGTLVLLRARAARDGATVVTLLAAVVPALLLLPVTIGQPMPGAIDLAGFAALGLIGNVGVQLVARGYARLTAQAGAVMEFTALPWSALLGWVVFAEPVRPPVLAGAAIILAACLMASRSPKPVP